MRAVCFSVLLLLGCNRSASELPQGPAPSPTVHAPAANVPPGHPPVAAGTNVPSAPTAPSAPAAPTAPSGGELRWDDPPGWRSVTPASRMRRAQYVLPRAAGDEADAELVVITFGAGQGGDVQSNLERWYGQVTQADGTPSRDRARVNNLTVGELRITIAEVAGRLGGGGMPGMPAPATIERGKLLAAIVDAPSGAWFFKITGPEATVTAARPAFETMLRSLRTSP